MRLTKSLKMIGLTSVVIITMALTGCSLFSGEKVSDPPEPPTEGAGNLLKNSGFEDLQDGWAVSWQIPIDISDPTKVTVASEAARSGDYGILMKDAVGDEVLSVQQSVSDISAEQQYEITAWVKTASPVDAVRLSVRFYNDGSGLPRFDKLFYTDDEESEFDTDGEWQQITYRVTSQPGANSAIVYFRSYAPGTVYYDDVSFRLVE